MENRIKYYRGMPKLISESQYLAERQKGATLEYICNKYKVNRKTLYTYREEWGHVNDGNVGLYTRRLK